MLNVDVSAESVSTALNAYSGTIDYPEDMLDVVSLSTFGSITNLWVTEPVVVEPGQVTFEGGVPQPGYKGSQGKLFRVQFRMKREGKALVSFESGAILANDGRATNILTSLGKAEYFIGPAGSYSTTGITDPGTPVAPNISSPTHPNSEGWYSNSNPVFVWTVPKGVTAVQTSLTQAPHSIPTVRYAPAIHSKELTEVNDGVWYFHARFQNENGWGSTTHFRFQIDTTKPDFLRVKEIPRDDKTNPVVRLFIEAEGRISGIDHFEIDIDGVTNEKWIDDGSHIFTAKPLDPGKHGFIVKVFDKAGNNLFTSLEAMIDPLFTPRITKYPDNLDDGQTYVVQGESSYPNSMVRLRLEREGDRAELFDIDTGIDGRFSFVLSDKLRGGVYSLDARAIDSRGAKSEWSNPLRFVIQKSAFLQLAQKMMVVLAVIIPLLALVGFFIFLVWYGWHKFFALKKYFKKRVHETELELDRKLERSELGVQRHIELLENKKRDGKKLTSEEKKTLSWLKDEMKSTRRMVEESLHDIEDDVK